MVHVSDLIVNAMEIGSSGENSVPVLYGEAWSSLDLPLDVLPLLVEQVDEQFSETANVILAPS